MNNVTRSIFRAIHEGKWLSIEYKNQQTQQTKYWVAVKGLNPRTRTLTVDGAEVPLTRTEFNIVELLAAHPRKVYTKQELFELAWGEPFAADDSTVSVHVSNIRAKLKPTGTDGYVQTVWGLGFKLAVDEGA